MMPEALVAELRATREHTRAVADALGGTHEYGPISQSLIRRAGSWGM